MDKYIIKDEDYNQKEKDSCIIEYIAKEDKFYLNDMNKKEEIDDLYKFFKKNLIMNDIIIFYLDFSNIDLSLKKSDLLVCIFKKLQKIRSLKEKKILVYRVPGKSFYEEFVEYSICLLNYKSKNDKYNYLYDSICKYLDDRVVQTNACKFKDDKCIAKRNTNCTMGCCHHFKNIYFGMLYEKKMHLCEYQKDKCCIAKCITCKMYMCDTLKKKGYKYTTSNVILIKRYFNPLQKLIIITSFFKTKEKIMKSLMFFQFSGKKIYSYNVCIVDIIMRIRNNWNIELKNYLKKTLLSLYS